MAASPKLHYQDETGAPPGAYNSGAVASLSSNISAEWSKWSGQLVNGQFRLQQFLGGSDHSAVFLTQYKGAKAAIKLAPANPETAESQLSRWRLASKLSHPNLLRIYDLGRGRIDSTQIIYVVMELADEDLSQILPQRALAPEEARAMLKPTLDAMTYIHSERCVHGRVRPSNILAVGEELKLSSDSISASGEALGHENSEYNAPESRTGTISPAADVWSLGVTVVQALTQRFPDRTSTGQPVFPPGMAEPFQEIARRCLHPDPQQRWTVKQIAARLEPKPSRDESSIAGPVATRPAAAANADQKDGALAKWLYAVPVVIAIVIAFLLSGSKAKHTNPAPAAQKTAPASANGAEEAKPTPEPKRSPATPAPSPRVNTAPVIQERTPSGGAMQDVVHPVIPSVSRGARNTITGRVRVRVRVTVDPSGNVTAARFESTGPSQYFARLAMEAARQWKFVPAEGTSGTREWTLRFAFGRADTEVVPARVSG